MRDSALCQKVQQAPAGAKMRKWVLNDATNANHHGVVNLQESPLYLHLSWRRSAKDSIQFVGIFRLDLPGLLQNSYVRIEPKRPSGTEIRLRIKHKDDGKFYIEVNDKGPSLMLNHEIIYDNNQLSESEDIKPKLSLNKNELNQLIISKQIFLHGLEHSTKSGQIDRMIAIHNIHNSIEIIIRTIFYHSDKKYSDKRFDELIGEANEVYKKRTGKDLPLMKQIKSLNIQRNLVQHDADDPSQNVVNKYSILSRSFLEEVFENYYNISLEEISPIDLIQNQKIKTLLILAMEFRTSDLNKFMIYLTRAFYWGILNIQNIFPSKFSDEHLAGSLSWIDFLTSQEEVMNMIKFRNDEFRFRIHQYQYSSQKGEIRESFTRMMDGFEYHLGTKLSLLGVGIDVFKYNKFKNITRLWKTILFRNKDEKRISIYWPKNPDEIINNNITEELLNYVIETLYDIESKGFELHINEDYLEFFRILQEWDMKKINIIET